MWKGCYEESCSNTWNHFQETSGKSGEFVISKIPNFFGPNFFWNPVFLFFVSHRFPLCDSTSVLLSQVREVKLERWKRKKWNSGIELSTTGRFIKNTWRIGSGGSGGFSIGSGQIQIQAQFQIQNGQLYGSITFLTLIGCWQNRCRLKALTETYRSAPFMAKTESCR